MLCASISSLKLFFVFMLEPLSFTEVFDSENACIFETSYNLVVVPYLPVSRVSERHRITVITLSSARDKK